MKKRKIVGVISGKGGVGKTSIVVNLGLAMYKLGEEAVVVDGDLKNPNLSLHLGVWAQNFTIHDVLEKRIPISEALYIHESGLRFIPAHLSLSYLNTDPDELKDVFTNFNYQVLIDSPPGLGKDVISILKVCDEALFVTTPYLPDIIDCLKTIEIAKDMNVRVKGIVLNSIRKKRYEFKKKEIETSTGTRILHSIPWDENVLKSLAVKIPVVEYKPFSPASIAFYELASKLSKKEYKPPVFLGLRRLFSF